MKKLVTLVLVLLVSVGGCALFGAHGSFWPAVAHCGPTSKDLESQVEAVLLAGGDWEAELKQIALKDGAETVECAVQAAIDLLTSKLSRTDPSATFAVIRGQAFLQKVHAGTEP